MSCNDKYLPRYAEPESHSVAALPAQYRFDHCVVIPARNESAHFLQRFAHTFTQLDKTILLILVVNQPPSQASITENQQLVSDAYRLFPDERWTASNLSLRQHRNMYLLLVDRFSTATIPKDQGVGLARKIGGDIACQLFNTSKLLSRWVHSTDADTHLPNNYFSPSTQQQHNHTSALIFEFKHTPENSDQKCIAATELYEQALRYFRQGLEFAGSPYAFFTLGSTLCYSIPHYMQARGFPKRAGGEDFYVLNKLAKLGNIVFEKNTIIRIGIRYSDRVPFGTGPAIAKIARLKNPQCDYLYYNPLIFQQLKRWLDAKTLLWEELQRPELFFTHLPVHIQRALTTLGIEKFIRHAQQHCKNEQAFSRHFHQWFDAFLTLKFLHTLQAHGYPPTPLQTSTAELEQWLDD